MTGPNSCWLTLRPRALPDAIYAHVCTVGFSIFGKYFLYQYLSGKLKRKRLIKLTHFQKLNFSVSKLFLWRTKERNISGLKSHTVYFTTTQLHNYSTAWTQSRVCGNEWAWQCFNETLFTKTDGGLNLAHSLLTPVLWYLSWYSRHVTSALTLFNFIVYQSVFQFPSYFGFLLLVFIVFVFFFFPNKLLLDKFLQIFLCQKKSAHLWG